MSRNLQKITVTNHEIDRSDLILGKLKRRAEQIGYGALICEIQIHQGHIKQIEITATRERMRADND